jgi:hypothetical protein
MHSISESLIDELTASTHELRGSLTELFAALGIDARRAPSLTRRLRLDKSLAWKLTTIVKSADPGAAVRHLPGAAAFEILLSAAKNAGAAPRAIERAQSAYQSLQHVVERHTGDRPTLELVMDSMPQAPAGRLEMSRKLAFRGNSGIWGVQAKTRLCAAFVAPSPDDPDMHDVANLGGWVGFRRLRADARWALFRVAVFDSNKETPPPYLPLDPEESTDGPMLLRKFCTSTLPPIQASPDGSGDVVYELGESSIGNTGAFDCFYGSKIPQIGSKWADEQDDRGEFAATISAPVESLQFDLLVHRDCEFATRTSTQVYGVANLIPATRHARDLIPLELDRVEIGRFPPVVDTPRIPGYATVINHVMERCGWDRRDFIGIRYTLEYPPFPSTVVISFPLASR